jgi:hypothetical protein
MKHWWNRTSVHVFPYTLTYFSSTSLIPGQLLISDRTELRGQLYSKHRNTGIHCSKAFKKAFYILLVGFGRACEPVLCALVF